MSPNNERRTKDETVSFGGFVRPLEMGDLVQLKPILEHWVKSRDTGQPLPEEVLEDLQLMEDSVNRLNDYRYFTAVGVKGEVVGVIGMRPPDSRMLALDFLQTDKPVELVNAYVDPKQRGGKGVGRALVGMLEQAAVVQGYTEVVLNSGPRYRDTGWGFYDKLPGYQRVGVAIGYFGEDGDPPVWKKSLVS